MRWCPRCAAQCKGLKGTGTPVFRAKQRAFNKTHKKIGDMTYLPWKSSGWIRNQKGCFFKASHSKNQKTSESKQVSGVLFLSALFPIKLVFGYGISEGSVQPATFIRKHLLVGSFWAADCFPSRSWRPNSNQKCWWLGRKISWHTKIQWTKCG